MVIMGFVTLALMLFSIAVVAVCLCIIFVAFVVDMVKDLFGK